MTPFDRCLGVTLGHEGNDVLTDDPRDPGGLTRWGISAAAHPNVDIRNLTREDAAEIYRRDYWQPLRCDELPLPIALCVFDCGVNQGVNTAVRLLQSVIGAQIDGTFGPRTLMAVFRSPVEQLTRRFMTARLHKYMSLGHWHTYGRGWGARVLDVAMTAAEWNQPE